MEHKKDQPGSCSSNAPKTGSCGSDVKKEQAGSCGSDAKKAEEKTGSCGSSSDKKGSCH